MRVLVTGAAGSIGRVLTPGLTALGHQVVGLDRVPAAEDVDSGVAAWHQHQVDCTDAAAVDAVVAAEHPDAIVHLAGIPDERSLAVELDSHVLTTAALLDAMVAHGVPRLVYASSNHAVGRTTRADGDLTAAALPRPDTYYGVAKVAAEALIGLFADRHGIDAVCCRIGSFLEAPVSVRGLSTWLSPGDCVRMVQAALSAPSPGFAVLYGISANTRAWWDLEPGRALGYEPLDDAEEYADQVPASPEDDAEAEFVGGPFATPAFYQPATGD